MSEYVSVEKQKELLQQAGHSVEEAQQALRNRDVLLLSTIQKALISLAEERHGTEDADDLEAMAESILIRMGPLGDLIYGPTELS